MKNRIKKMMTFNLCLMLSFSIFVQTHLSAKESSPEFALELLKKTDLARGGVLEGLSWNSNIKTFEDGEETLRNLKIKAKNTDALVETIAPLRSVGEVYIFNDRNMWFMKPGLKKPVSISSRAKLTGLASNGDIASTWYARDYTPTIEKQEVIEGVKHFVLMLKAKSDVSTYDQIRYWVNSKTHLAVRAEFLSLQGQVLKKATFEYNNKIQLNGQKYSFVSRMEIQDAKQSSYRSLISYSDLKLEKFKQGEFNISNVRK